MAKRIHRMPLRWQQTDRFPYLIAECGRMVPWARAVKRWRNVTCKLCLQRKPR
jgi:hypothetical protein